MTRKTGEMLERHGREAVVCPVFDDDAGGAVQPIGFRTAKLEDELTSAEMIIAFGGDGTILRAARAAADYSVPILGINMGGKGFIAEIEVEEIDLINSAATGAYDVESRMMLDAEVVRDGNTVCRDFALNDIVLRGDNKVIDLTLYGDGQIISDFSGDGAIIATPTGSTAYSMAAGGPIVEPTAHNILVTPICAHVLEAKPFVLASDRRVSIEVGYNKHSPAYMSADGCERVNIQSGDVINEKKSGKLTRLVRLSNRSFYRKVSEKLGERL
jgi:NAD+ kinase